MRSRAAKRFSNNDDQTTMKKKLYRHQTDQGAHDKMSKMHTTSFLGRTTRTSQSERDNTDLNVLARRFGIAAMVRPIDAKQFGHWEMLDLHSALMTVSEAETAFNGLPAKVRERFKNDPLELLAAIKDEDRREELELLGIFKPSPLPTLPSDPPSPPATEKPSA